MQRAILIVIGLIGVALATLVQKNADLGIENVKAAYIQESEHDAADVAKKFQSELDDIYRAKRTIARLPGVRSLDMFAQSGSMDHGGSSLDTNTQLTIQEIYNALATDVSVSELYIVPLTLDPDSTDPTGRRPTEPIITFDKLIIGKSLKDDLVQNLEDEENEEIEEIEIYEYRVMREQLDTMQRIYSTNEHIVDLNYPAISSVPVITCDNSQYDPNHPDDERRKGLVMSVPIFDNDGILSGCVSAVILTDTLSDILPSASYSISNLTTDYLVHPKDPGQWQRSRRFTDLTTPDDSLIFSTVEPIESNEPQSQWILWAGQPDSMFWNRSDVKATLHARLIGFIATAILTSLAMLSTLLIFNAYKRLAKINSGLESTVEERTQELSASRDRALLALRREQEVSIELKYQKRALDKHAIVSMTDITGQIIYVNDQFCAISGYSRQEIIGQSHRLLKSGEHSKEFYQNLWKTISSGKVWKGEIKNSTKDGGYYWVNATIVPFKDAAGKIQKYVAIRADITERKDNNEQLEESNATLTVALQREKSTLQRLEVTMDKLEMLATTDKLTGLPNRTVFNDRLIHEMKHAHREGSKFAVLFFDFDRFKMINDSLGHEIGDALLISIADIFRHELRDEDTVARFGGDEFVVLLTNITDWDDAVLKGEKLLKAFAKPHQLGDHLVVSTASIGLITNQHDHATPGELIRDADAAMYQAKATGKNKIVIFDQQMHEDAMDALSLEIDLRQAVREGQLRLVYQPIMELANGTLKGFESLIRWDHPTRGVISPAKFIPIAEESGLINDIGKWIFKSAAHQARAWNTEFHPSTPITVNVNVSKRQLLDPKFIDYALECKNQNALHNTELQIEITESTIVDARSNVIPVLNNLREQGFPIVMDDFGTGVSSLSTLHAFPIDVLKIDQSFIKVLSGDRSLLAVVSSITSLAENLGIRTVAEGVENQDVVGALQSIGCTWGQGYYFAKPLSIEDATAYITEHLSAQTRAA